MQIRFASSICGVRVTMQAWTTWQAPDIIAIAKFLSVYMVVSVINNCDPQILKALRHAAYERRLICARCRKSVMQVSLRNQPPHVLPLHAWLWLKFRPHNTCVESLMHHQLVCANTINNYSQRSPPCIQQWSELQTGSSAGVAGPCPPQ